MRRGSLTSSPAPHGGFVRSGLEGAPVGHGSPDGGSVGARWA